MMKTGLQWIGGCIAALAVADGSGIETPDYRVDDSFGAQGLSSVPVMVAVDAKDQLYALLANGAVNIFDPAGKVAQSFSTDMTPAPSALAVNGGKIYLLSTSTRDKDVEYQGRKLKMKESIGVNCGVFSETGAKEADIAMPGILSAKDAHFVGNQLAIADYSKKQIAFFDVTDDNVKADRVIGNEFRLCCGIFDFCPAANGKSILVANLGAFKVQTFTGDRRSAEFGARGEELDQFHGCCNPVNVADLGEEALITVEKSPTRVKICSRKGKAPKTIPGLGELVDGCSTIPIAVDSKGSIYLASSRRSSIVRCVPVAGAKTRVGSAENSNRGKAGLAELSEVRVWRDVSGRTVEGKLLSFEGGATEAALVRDGKVRLLVNQRTFELPLDRLAESDRQFVEKVASARDMMSR